MCRRHVHLSYIYVGWGISNATTRLVFGQLALENTEYSSIFVGHKDNKASFHEKKFSL